jgi:predicted nucleic acid-binding protein
VRSVLVDTGPIVAILSPSDANHSICVEQLRELRCPLATCWPVLTEAAWLLRHDPAVITVLVKSFQIGPFELAPLDSSDLAPVADLLHRYRNLNLQLADAALLHLANRERIETVFTLDRRDFETVRLKTGKKLELIPPRDK